MALFSPSHVELRGCRHRVSGESDLTQAEGLLGEYYEGKKKQGSWGHE